MGRAIDFHKRAILDRKRIETDMGHRWKDSVRRAIDGQVLAEVERAEQQYLNRLYELDEVHRKARDRLRTLKSAPLLR